MWLVIIQSSVSPCWQHNSQTFQSCFSKGDTLLRDQVNQWGHLALTAYSQQKSRVILALRTHLYCQVKNRNEPKTICAPSWRVNEKSVFGSKWHVLLAFLVYFVWHTSLLVATEAIYSPPNQTMMIQNEIFPTGSRTIIIQALYDCVFSMSQRSFFWEFLCVGSLCGVGFDNRKMCRNHTFEKDIITTNG